MMRRSAAFLATVLILGALSLVVLLDLDSTHTSLLPEPVMAISDRAGLSAPASGDAAPWGARAATSSASGPWAGDPAGVGGAVLRRAREAFRPTAKQSAECNKWLSRPRSGKRVGKFVSQYGQDSILYRLFFRHLGDRPGVYVDLAAYAPRDISNSYFFDVCLGWRGLCIEGDPAKAQFFSNKTRGCRFVPKCIADATGKSVVFTSHPRHGGSAIINNKNPMPNQNYEEIRLECSTLGEELRLSGAPRVDFLSLDIEGGEADALRGIDWDRGPQIDVIVAEDNSRSRGKGRDTVEDYQGVLSVKGYIYIGDTDMRGRGTDAIWVHRDSWWARNCDLEAYVRGPIRDRIKRDLRCAPPPIVRVNKV